MARLSLDKEGGAFFDLKISQRSEGFGAIAHLRVPKGVGRSSLVLHESFFWGTDTSECRAFIDGMNSKKGGVTFLRNGSTFFSFWRKPSGQVLFEARCFTGNGEIAYRMEVTSAELRCFYDKLKRICEGMMPADD